MMDYRIYRGKFEVPSEKEFLAKIREIGESEQVYIILFDSSAIAGCDHMRAALFLAERSYFEYKTPISKFFEMETLLYALGTRQTEVAANFGIRRGFNDSFVLLCRMITEFGESFDVVSGKISEKISNLKECEGGRLQVLKEEECQKISRGKMKKGISKLMEVFFITPEELEICGEDRIEEIVIERCCLLGINK